jgi:E3 ubiquitin-protein ligase EDD1
VSLLPEEEATAAAQCTADGASAAGTDEETGGEAGGEAANAAAPRGAFGGMAEAGDDPYRLLLYRCVGRLVGLCLLSHCVLPLHFSRHVLKFLLGRELGFHDLAFFDSTQYEALRQVLAVHGASQEGLEAMALSFRVALPAALGGVEVDLVPGGEDVSVTPSNVHEYVELYAQTLMVGPALPALLAMRGGLREVLKAELLADLTAENLRLLLNGTTSMDIGLLRRVALFKMETPNKEHFDRLKEWFWDIVENMTVEQQHDLCYFWTSSPSLPATKEGFAAQPLVVVRPPSDSLLPTANTCSARLNLPAYSTAQILRDKLLMAIQTKGFGFV